MQASKKTLSKVKAEDNRLKEKRDNLKDPDYVAKFIRNKFFYSKNNEKVYIFQMEIKINEVSSW